MITFKKKKEVKNDSMNKMVIKLHWLKEVIGVVLVILFYFLFN